MAAADSATDNRSLPPARLRRTRRGRAFETKDVHTTPAAQPREHTTWESSDPELQRRVLEGAVEASDGLATRQSAIARISLQSLVQVESYHCRPLDQKREVLHPQSPAFPKRKENQTCSSHIRVRHLCRGLRISARVVFADQDVDGSMERSQLHPTVPSRAPSKNLPSADHSEMLCLNLAAAQERWREGSQSSRCPA